MTFKREERSGVLSARTAVLAAAMVFGFCGFSEAADATVSGVISARAVYDNSILLRMPYTGDDNGNNTYTVQYKPCTEAVYNPWITNAPHTGSPYKTTITGLATNSCYDIRVTCIDADGVSGTGIQTLRITSTWDNTLLHNVNRFPGSGKWAAEGGWGLPGTKYGKIDCSTCHTPRAGNIKGIADMITAPNGTDQFPEQTGGLGINFKSLITPNGFGDDAGGHTESRKVCEYCHSQTTYHRYNTAGQSVLTHNNNTNCLLCHPHAAGFYYATGACDSCHGNPPVINGTGGPEGLASAPPTGSLTAGAHGAHTEKSVACSSCHYMSTGAGTTHGDSSVTLGFYAFDGGYQGGTYDGQTTVNSYDAAATAPATAVSKTGTKTCSNIYCHGATMTPNGGTDTTPVWDSQSTGVCGTCHGATAANPPLLGSHRTHTMNTEWSYAPNYIEPFNNYIYGRNLACTVCHNNFISNHINGKADWSFDTATYPWISGAQYKGSPAGISSPVPASYGQCTNLYCHSIIQTNTGGPLTGLPGEYKTPTWGNRTEGNCGSCHAVDAGHAYWSGSPGPPPEIDTGSHDKHLYVLGLNSGLGSTPGGPGRCAVCHNYSGSDSLLGCSTLCHNNGSLHVNYQLDIKFAPRYGGSSAVYNGTPVPGDGFGSCSNTYCHSNGASVSTGTIPGNTSLVWGSGTLSCNACHSYPPDYTNGSPKANSHQAHSHKTCDNCHYSTTTDGTTITNNTNHANKSYNLQESGGAVTFTPSVANPSTCATISCHGGGSATWGVRINCDGCHAYPPVPGDGKNINDQYDGGKGVHVTSLQAYDPYGMGGHIVNPSSLNPAADIYGDLTTGYNECVKCHKDGVHGNGIVDVNMSSESWSTTTPKGLYIRSNGLGDTLGTPQYNGLPGDTAVPKSCSSIICHQGDTPQWSCPGGE